MMGLFSFFKKLQQTCSVYCNESADIAIVASIWETDGPLVEADGGSVVVKLKNEAQLQNAIEFALHSYSVNNSFSFQVRKRRDWPAFKASGQKTIRQFENDFITFCISAVDKNNAQFDVIPCKDTFHLNDQKQTVNRSEIARTIYALLSQLK